MQPGRSPYSYLKPLAYWTCHTAMAPSPHASRLTANHRAGAYHCFRTPGGEPTAFWTTAGPARRIGVLIKRGVTYTTQPATAANNSVVLARSGRLDNPAITVNGGMVAWLDLWRRGRQPMVRFFALKPPKFDHISNQDARRRNRPDAFW